MKKILILMLMSFITAASLSAEANYRNFDELKALLESDADDYLFLDVRTGPEYGAGHIPGAENISYNLLPGALPEGTEKDKTIIVYCRSGNRSGTAKRLLEKAGYTNVHDFGGISRWKGDLE